MALVNCKECGKQISNQAKNCPNCGFKQPPRTTGATKAILVIIVGIFIIAILNSMVKGCSESMQNMKQESESKKSRLSDSISIVQTTYKQGMSLKELMAYYKKSKLYNTKSNQHELLIKELCKEYLSEGNIILDSIIKDKYALSIPIEYYDEIMDLCNTDKATDLNKLSSFQVKYQKAKNVIVANNLSYQKRKKEQEEIIKTQVRIDYAKELRNRYLDQNLDIKVTVTGKNNTKITLTFALFNDVWSHKMSQGSLLSEIQNMGFKKLTMTDGYDYSVYWDFK